MPTNNRKRKSGRQPKSRPPETTVLENATTITTSPPADNDADVLFSVNNVELVSPSSPSSSHHHGRRRGRPRKTPKIGPANAKTLPMSVSVPPIANGFVSTGMIHAESVVARVVPAMDSVVKVFCVHTEPNFSLPWQRKRQYSSSSSGFVIKGRRVLTNAHSVEHYTQVKLKKRGSDTKYVATVLAIGTECDIVMSRETKLKRKRGESPKNAPDEITVLDNPTTIDAAVVLSMRNVGLISPNSPPSSSRHDGSLPNKTSEHESEIRATDVQPSSDSYMMINLERPDDVLFSLRRSDPISLSYPPQPSLPRITIIDNNVSVTSSLPTTITSETALPIRQMKLSDFLSSPSSQRHHSLLSGNTNLEPNMLSISPPSIADGSISTNVDNMASGHMLDAVVKVSCYHNEPNFSLPWQMKRQYLSSSSGFIVKGRRVLTNAHSVEYYAQVKLRRRGCDIKYLATVLAIGTECDIGEGFGFVILVR